MSNQQKIGANRANSRKSTGPETAAGKAASRNNALEHGMRSQTVVLPGEDHAQYTRLYNDIAAEFKPATPHEQWLAKQMADAHWRLERLKGIETALLSDEDIDTAALDRNSRWQVRMERSFYRAHHELKSLIEAAGAARPTVQAAEEENAPHSIQ